MSISYLKLQYFRPCVLYVNLRTGPADDPFFDLLVMIHRVAHGTLKVVHTLLVLSVYRNLEIQACVLQHPN